MVITVEVGVQGGLLLASSGQKLVKLLNVLLCTGQPPPQRMICSQMSVVLGLRNRDLA